MSETTGDMSLIQDEDQLRKMWQDTEDFGKKKEIRSHMYKVREARLKDFYNTGEEKTSSSESRQHSTSTTSTTRSNTTGLKGSDLMMHADNLADHSFLSLKSKEIRDSESPTKDSYKISDSRKINDRDWNIIETNEASKDGKTHTTSKVATTSGKQDLDGGELSYAAKSQQKASVYKDGDDKNFTKATEASSQNVIKQEAFGGDENNKFYSTSTTSTSSSKFSSEHRSVTDDSADRAPVGDTRHQKITTTYKDRPAFDSSDSKTVVRKVYTENIPNELRNHPSYVDGNTKVTTETKTLPDGSTVTTTRYETKGAKQYSTSSTSSTTSSSKRHVSSNEQNSKNVSTSHATTHDTGRDLDDRRSVIRDSSVYDNKNNNSNTTKYITSTQTESKSFVDKSNVARNETENHYVSEKDVRRIQDASLIGRDTRNVQNIDVQIVKTHELPGEDTRVITTTTKDIQNIYRDQPNDNKDSVIVKTFTIPTQDNHTTTTKVSKTVSSKYDTQQVASTDFLNVERQHVVDTKTSTINVEDLKPITSGKPPTREITEVTKEIKYVTPKSQPTQIKPRDTVEVEITTTKEEHVRRDEPRYVQPSREPVRDRKPYQETIEIEIIPNKERPGKDEPRYEQPERRQPIRPGKSEFDERPVATDGQYDTTYRSDYVPRRISVEVSPTHDAFARSLRSISPDRVSKTGSTRSLRTISTTSLRSTSSPDRYPGKPGKTSPANSRPLSPMKKHSKSPEKHPCVDIVTRKRPESPGKKSPEKYHYVDVVSKKRPESPENKSPDYSQRVVGRNTRDDERTTTKQTHSTHGVNTDTITRRKKTTHGETEVDNSTLTRKKQITRKPRSRSASPTSIASDIEFIRHGAEIVTDLDADETNRHSLEDIKLTRRHTEEFDQRSNILETTDTRKLQKVTDKSATLPLADVTSKRAPHSPTKDSPKSRSPTKEPTEPSTEKGKPKSIRRTDTYQQRCEEILGISDVTDTPRKSSLPIIPKRTDQSPSKTDVVKQASIKDKDKKSPEKQKPSEIQEFPSHVRKSPTKEPHQSSVDKIKGTKQLPGKTSSPEKPRSDKKAPSVQEFPSQVRKPTEREPIEPYPEKVKNDKQAPSVKEFPSQIRKSPVKEPLEPYPEKPKGDKTSPSVQEFPSQIRKTSVKELLEPYPEKTKRDKTSPSVQEFPSQIRKTPVKEPLEPYPEKTKGDKTSPSVQEFPSQVRKSPVKEPLEPYPEKPRGDKTSPSVQEFPSQIRKSPVKEPLEPYPEKPRSDKISPSVQEFPSQVRRTPEKEPLEEYPERPKTDKYAPSVQEFPSQVRKPTQKEPLEPYPEKAKHDRQAPSVQEFPSQIRKSPQKEPLEPYPQKPSTDKEAPSQLRRPVEKEHLEPYPEKLRPHKGVPTGEEFPSQISEKPKSEKKGPSTYDIPSQTAKSPEKESQEFPPLIRRPLEKQPTETLPEQHKSVKQIPGKQKSPEKQKPEPRQEKPKETKDVPSQEDQPKEYPAYYPVEPSYLIDKPLEKSSDRVSLDDLPNIKTDKISLDDIPSAIKPDRKSPEKISLYDLDYRPGEAVDNFITNEKADTEITLKKYKDGSIHRPRGIPDTKTQEKVVKETTKVLKKTKKDKISTVTAGDETESTTDEEEDLDDIEDQIIDDICDVVKCEDGVINEEVTKVTMTQQTRLPIKEEPKTDKAQKSPAKSKPKNEKPRKPPVEDFITVTKTQLLQTESKTPIEEPIHTKKFIRELRDDEEEDRLTKQRTVIEKEITTKNIISNESTVRPNKTVKKDHSDKAGPISKVPDKKKQTELLIKKEKLDTNVKSKIDSRRTDVKISPRGTPKKIPDGNKVSPISKDTEKKIYQTEYTEEYCTTKDKKVSKPIPRASAPVKQTKKTVTQEIVNTTDTLKDTKFHVKIDKIDTTSKRTNHLDKKLISKRPISPYKKPEDQQPKQPTKLKTTEVKQPRTIVRTTLQKTVEVQPTKRHVVSTIINIKPKTKPETITKTIHKTTVTRTINAPKTSKATPKSTKTKQKPITNGHISTEEEESDVEIIKDSEDHPIREPKRYTDRVTPVRRSPFTRPGDTGDKKKHCITTKSILIENAVADQREIIVDLRRSKSSREGTPDRICPYPVKVDADLGSPRYPDRVTEPDDGTYRPKPKKVSDIPISETEDVTHFDRIKDVTEDTVSTTRTQMETTDECLLSVNEKVNKFLSTAEQITKKSLDAKPAPKVERPKLEVDDTLREDECLLSVSDKVQKFLTTAEQLTTSTKDVLQISKSPKYKDTKPNVDEEDDSPKPIKYKIVSSAPKDDVEPKSKDLTRDTTEPTRIVRPEERVYTRTSVSPEKKDRTSRPKSRESPDHTEIDSIKYRTPERRTSDLYTKKTTEELIKIRKESFEDDDTPKTSRRLSKDEPKTVLSPTGRLRSTETIKRAKALFENIGKDQETITRQKDILNRPSVFEGRKLKKTEEVSEEKKLRDVRTKLTYDEVRRSPSPSKQPQTKIKHREPTPDEEIPHYMTPLDRTVKEHRPEKKDADRESVADSESSRSRSASPDGNVPHYMLPLDRSVREKSPHKENLKQLEDIMSKSITTTQSDEVDAKTTKFGVTLRRTDSGRMLSSFRKTSTSSMDKQTTEEIEEIFDLEYLEKLLETIVGYDIRRRIRAQIRIVKRAIEENTLEHLITSRRVSPSKDSPRRQPVDKDEPTSYVTRYSSTDRRKQSEDVTVTEVSEYKSSYQRKTSSEISSTFKSSSPAREASPKKVKDKSVSPVRKSKTPEAEPIERKSSITSRIFQTDLKKAKPIAKSAVEDKPEWVTQRTLRKVTETSAPVKKTVTTTVKKVVTRSENEDAKPTDVITSSYGVGPTDENGAPLFGLKALRTQNKSEKTKVQGTVIRSQYYSENGEEPQGEISVTKYSTDPGDLGTENVTREKGIASVTTTQKFGYKGTPSLKTVAGKTKKTSGEEEHKSSVKTSKVTRRGSVKEISQKFIENAVDTLKNERQSSYPKAGLILRTSSFKDTPGNDTDSSREGSPATQEVRQKTVTTVETTTTTSGDKKADTFLTNKSRVTGVQDTISRMKTQDVEIEESEEDAEARNLLNKFIGSQVLLSGMESHVSKVPVATTPSGSVKSTTKITTTTTSSEGSKPTTVTRTFTHPITVELLETIWDEQTLKLLLEQSTDYEDRRIIRARLREVMAEQEACAELVEKASDEAAIKQSGSTVHGTTTSTYTEGPVTSTSQVTTRITSQQQQIKKPMSPFAKFRQLDKQNSLNSPPSTPKSPTCGGPLFKFTDPALNQSANTVKQRLLQWCQMKTKEYENIQLDNFSTSWANGMGFCALIHHFLPDAFDYNALNPKNRRHNFTLAFTVADEKAGIAPLLDVDDMVAISKPDWKCVFTYVQSIYRRFKDED